ncbi:MAG: hybrid sensor histidine kinase/response regulator [Chitinophagaceae bacterium]
MILVVDDTRENIFSLLQLLEMIGFDADAAYSGEEALKKALKTDYSLIILDVQMPGMDGFEVANALGGNNKTKDIPIIFLSAVNTDIKYISKGYASGAVDYITKPFDPDILLLKIKTFQRLYHQTAALQAIQEDLRKEIEIRKDAEAKKDAFVSIASHELKTPLTSLKGYLQMLDRFYDTLDKADTAKFIRSAHNQVNKLTILVNELLDMSKIENGKLQFNFEHFNIKQVVDNSVELMKQVNPEADIVCEGDTNVSVVADKLRIEQVLVNYLSNAIKYSPDNKHIKIAVQQNKDSLIVSVTDKGIGIPASKQEKIFSKFFRVEEYSDRFQGMGIGLYICAEIIERHSGKYGVDSIPGQGSTFYFELPLQQNPTNDPA